MTDGTAQSFRVFGLTWRSHLPLAGLPPVEDGAAPEIEIVVGDVPAELSEVVRRGVRFQAARGALRLQVDGVATFVVTDRRIAIQPTTCATADDVSAFLLGPAIGALLHLRGELVLRASVVDWRGEAVAFLGRSGAGKSTVAAAFRQRGCATLTDELCVVRRDDMGRLVALPGFPFARLWPDALQQLGLPPAGLARVRPAIEKRIVPLRGAIADEARPVRKLYVLRPQNRDEATFTAVTSAAKLVALPRHLASGAFFSDEFGDARRRENTLRLAQTAAMSVIDRGGDLARLDGLIDAIEEDLRA